MNTSQRKVNIKSLQGGTMPELDSPPQQQLKGSSSRDNKTSNDNDTAAISTTPLHVAAVRTPADAKAMLLTAHRARAQAPKAPLHLTPPPPAILQAAAAGSLKQQRQRHTGVTNSNVLMPLRLFNDKQHSPKMMQQHHHIHTSPPAAAATATATAAAAAAIKATSTATASNGPLEEEHAREPNDGKDDIIDNTCNNHARQQHISSTTKQPAAKLKSNTNTLKTKQDRQRTTNNNTKAAANAKPRAGGAVSQRAAAAPATRNNTNSILAAQLRHHQTPAHLRMHTDANCTKSSATTPPLPTGTSTDAVIARLRAKLRHAESHRNAMASKLAAAEIDCIQAQSKRDEVMQQLSAVKRRNKALQHANLELKKEKHKLQQQQLKQRTSANKCQEPRHTVLVGASDMIAHTKSNQNVENQGADVMLMSQTAGLTSVGHAVIQQNVENMQHCNDSVFPQKCTEQRLNQELITTKQQLKSFIDRHQRLRTKYRFVKKMQTTSSNGAEPRTDQYNARVYDDKIATSTLKRLLKIPHNRLVVSIMKRCDITAADLAGWCCGHGDAPAKVVAGIKTLLVTLKTDIINSREQSLAFKNVSSPAEKTASMLLAVSPVPARRRGRQRSRRSAPRRRRQPQVGGDQTAKQKATRKRAASAHPHHRSTLADRRLEEHQQRVFLLDGRNDELRSRLNHAKNMKTKAVARLFAMVQAANDAMSGAMPVLAVEALPKKQDVMNNPQKMEQHDVNDGGGGDADDDNAAAESCFLTEVGDVHRHQNERQVAVIGPSVTDANKSISNGASVSLSVDANTMLASSRLPASDSRACIAALCLSNNGICDREVLLFSRVLARGGGGSVTQIDLRNNCISDLGLLWIADAVLMGRNSIHLVDLQENRITMDGLEALAWMLRDLRYSDDRSYLATSVDRLTGHGASPAIDDGASVIMACLDVDESDSGNCVLPVVEIVTSTRTVVFDLRFNRLNVTRRHERDLVRRKDRGGDIESMRADIATAGSIDSNNNADTSSGDVLVQQSLFRITSLLASCSDGRKHRNEVTDFDGLEIETAGRRLYERWMKQKVKEKDETSVMDAIFDEAAAHSPTAVQTAEAIDEWAIGSVGAATLVQEGGALSKRNGCPSGNNSARSASSLYYADDFEDDENCDNDGEDSGTQAPKRKREARWQAKVVNHSKTHPRRRMGASHSHAGKVESVPAGIASVRRLAMGDAYAQHGMWFRKTILARKGSPAVANSRSVGRLRPSTAGGVHKTRAVHKRGRPLTAH